jgi:probable rRNA maturation factor
MARFGDGLLDHLKLTNKEVSIAFVTDETIREYNKKFLGHDWATDVIAFGYGGTKSEGRRAKKDRPFGRPWSEGRAGWMSTLESDYLGDMVISVETAARNATRYHLSLAQELKNLILHGVLHLLGYDHETDRGEMRRLERALRRKLIA